MLKNEKIKKIFCYFKQASITTKIYFIHLLETFTVLLNTGYTSIKNLRN